MFHTYVYVQFSSPKNAIMELKWSLTCQKVVWLFEAKTKCVSSICVLLSLSCLDLMDDLLWEEEEEKFCTPFPPLFTIITTYGACNSVLQYIISTSIYMAWIKSKSFSKNLYAHQQITSNNHQKTMNQNQVMYHLQTLFFFKKH